MILIIFLDIHLSFLILILILYLFYVIKYLFIASIFKFNFKKHFDR